MKTNFIFIFVTLFLFFTVSISSAQNEKELDNWPQWREPLGTGAAVKGNPPTEFSETKNLKWKTAIHGRGHATPIVWEDKMVIQTAVETDEKVELATDPE